jgi:cell division protein ZipA
LAAELRWILLGLGVSLLAIIWWWTARRAGQTPGNAELRETIPSSDSPRPAPEPRDWGVPPFEPLNIRTAEFDRIPVLDRPMMAHADPEPLAAAEATAAEPTADDAIGAEATAAEPTAAGPIAAAPMAVDPQADSAAPTRTATPATNVAELQRIVTIRVCAVGETRWSGSQLMAALEMHGLAFGRYQVFHRKHVDGRSLFCVASLIEPGTFDVAVMSGQEFRGVTLFAVLPGPIAPLETLDELLRTGRGLAEELSGMVQDAKGMPLSPQRAAAMREDIARFQALLH